MTRVYLAAFQKLWNEFWYSPRDATTLCVFRVITGMIVLYSFLIYGWYMDEFISGQGYVSVELAQKFAVGALPFSVFFWAQEGIALYVAYGSCFLAGVAFVVGFGGRVTPWLVFLAYLSFTNRNPNVLFGFDEYQALYLAIFLINPGNQVLSVDSWLKSRRRTGKPSMIGFGQTSAQPSVSVNLAVRVFQVVFCARYFGAGYFKSADTWKTGDALWQVLSNFEFGNFDFTFLAPYWGWLGFVSQSVVLFELFFIPLMIIPFTRTPAIVFGILMHLGIGLTTPLTSFGVLLMAGYTLFVDEAWLRARLATIAGLTRWSQESDQLDQHARETAA